MKIIGKNIFVGITMMYAIVACSQTSSLHNYKAIEAICKDADIIEVEKKIDYTEVEFSCNGINYEVGIDMQGNRIYTEKAVSQTELPFDNIQKKISKKYPDWTIDEFSIIELTDTSFIKVELLKNGIEENAFFSLDGKWFKPKNYVGKDTWNMQDLSEIAYYSASPYNYLKPSTVIDLPETLREISGIAVVNNTTVLCVQDELGAVFSLDLQKQEITNMFRFTDIGDFEDITFNNDTAYVLRSDGTIFSFAYTNFSGNIQQKIVQASSLNIEGLCFNPFSKSFLLASKAPTVGKPDAERYIYEFTKKTIHSPQVYVTVKFDEIRAFVAKTYACIQKTNFEINPSGIAIHPQTKDLYVLSALDRCIAVYSDKKLQHVYVLPAELYYKPEGIGFLPNGDMILSSEGMKNGYVGGQIFVIPQKK